MKFEREVMIPANERRAELAAKIYKAKSDEWLNSPGRSLSTTRITQVGS